MRSMAAGGPLRMQAGSGGAEEYFPPTSGAMGAASVGRTIRGFNMDNSDLFAEGAGKGTSPYFSSLKRDVAGANDELAKMNGHFQNHLRSIVEFLAIAKVFELIASTVRTAADEMFRLEEVSARVGMIGGQGSGSTRGQMVGLSRYGIDPEQAGPGLIVAAQKKLTDEQISDAGKIALIYGTDYKNAVEEVYQAQMRLNDAGVKQVNIADYAATAYKSFGGSAEQALDALQKAAPLVSALGISAERGGLMLLDIAGRTEGTPETIGNTLQSIARRAIDPNRKGALSKYGIQDGEASDMMQQIAKVMHEIKLSGDQDMMQRFVTDLTGGQQAYKQMTELKSIFAAFYDEIQRGQQPLSDADAMVSKLGDTGAVKIQQLTAAWKGFLGALSDTTAFKQAVGGLGTFFEMMNVQSAGAAAGQEMTADQRAAAYKAFTEQTGIKIIDTPVGAMVQPTKSISNFLGQEAALSKFLLDWNRPKGATGLDEIGMGEFGSGISPIPNMEFGGFGELPKETSWDEFVKRIRKFEGPVEEGGIVGGGKTEGYSGYQLNQRTFAYYDQTLQQFRTLVADSNAIRYATEEQRKLMQQITGVFNVPSGGEFMVSFYALQQGFVPADRLGGGGLGAGGSAGGRGRGSAGGSLFDLHNQEGPAGRSSGTLRSKYETTDRMSPISDQNDRHQTPAKINLGGLVINNRVSLIVDGKVVATMLNQQLSSQSYGSGVGGSGGGGGGGSMMVM